MRNEYSDISGVSTRLCTRIKEGRYKGCYYYRGYVLINHGYYPPDKCVWWQAENVETGEADFSQQTKRDLKNEIDEWLDSNGC